MNLQERTRQDYIPTPLERRKLTVIELFAGIGSYAEALRRNGVDIQIKGISEIDTFAIQAHESLH